jgi:hypothetical protein
VPISFLGGGGAEIAIALDRPGGPYYPGDVIHAAITLESEKETKISGFRIGLLAWELSISEDSDGQTSRRETVDEMVAGETLIDDMALAAGFRGAYQVDLPIPRDAFPPYASSSLRSGWLVKATVDRGLKKDVTAEVELSLVVPPPGEHAQPGEVGESSDPDTVELRLWLPSLEWVEGETIEGRLLIQPRKSFDVGEVRLNLKREEKVHVPRYKSSSTDWIDRVVLAGKTRFQPGQEADLPFSFPIPVMGCPTRRTESTTVIYTLQAALSRRLRKDYTVSTEIWLYNGQGPG